MSYERRTRDPRIMLNARLASAALVLCVLAVLAFVVAPAGAASHTKTKSFARCIARSGAKFYGAYWCPYCLKQKQMFGSAASYLPYVECAKEGTRETLSRCKHISGFPQWIYADGSVGKGLQSFAALARATGCRAP